MTECKHIVRNVLCGKKDSCEYKYEFSRMVKDRGFEVYGFCEKIKAIK